MSELRHAAEIVAAYVANNQIPAEGVPDLIRSTVRALRGLAGSAPAEAASQAQATRAEIRRSITPTHLVSFIDGRSYTMLKRHLAAHDLTPQTYRQRFGLPDDYPMTAPDYSKRRAAIAKAFDLAGKGMQSRQGTGRGRKA